MIVWLASYPRSGNTLLRIALNQLYGVRSSVVYDHDGVAARLGGNLVGFEANANDYSAMRSGGLSFVKTHRQRDPKVAVDDAAICLVRDGRDALVSYARLLSEREPSTFEQRLQELIGRTDPTGTGGWGANVLSWLRRPQQTCAVMKFEDLISDPAEAVRIALGVVAPSLWSLADAKVPSFDDLARIDPGFFRSGRTGAWRDEMPGRLHDLFWSDADNREAMALLGYA